MANVSNGGPFHLPCLFIATYNATYKILKKEVMNHLDVYPYIFGNLKKMITSDCLYNSAANLSSSVSSRGRTEAMEIVYPHTPPCVGLKSLL